MGQVPSPVAIIERRKSGESFLLGTDEQVAAFAQQLIDISEAQEKEREALGFNLREFLIPMCIWGDYVFDIWLFKTKKERQDALKRWLSVFDAWIDWDTVRKDEMDTPVIVCEAGPEESILLTTRSELKAFAQLLLDDIQSAGQRDEYLGIAVRFVGRSYAQGLGQFMCHLVGLILVDTEEERRELIKRTKVDNGDLRIEPWDWN